MVFSLLMDFSLGWPCTCLHAGLNSYAEMLIAPLRHCSILHIIGLFCHNTNMMLIAGHLITAWERSQQSQDIICIPDPGWYWSVYWYLGWRVATGLQNHVRLWNGSGTFGTLHLTVWIWKFKWHSCLTVAARLFRQETANTGHWSSCGASWAVRASMW